MNLSRLLMLFIVGGNLLLVLNICAQNVLDNFNPLIEKGDFTKAQLEMRKEFAANLDMSPIDRLTLEYEIERLDRIRKDFTLTKDQVVEYIKKYIPDVDDPDLAR